LVLTEDQRRSWLRSGFLAYDEPLLSSDEIQALAQRTEDIATGRLDHVPSEMIGFEKGIPVDGLHGQARFDAVRIIRFLHRYDDLVLSVCKKPQILDVVEDLLGPNIKLYTDQFFMKPPFHGGAQSWHQDSGTWTMFAPHDHVTVWIALDEATVENGCLHYIPESHRYGYVDSSHLPNLVAQLQDQEVLIPRKPGYAAFHHSLTLHHTGPNTTAYRRRGLALHYIRAETRYIGNPSDRQPPFLLMRGQEFPGRV
jgi:phytanoyl-CoA hydroxylase